MKEFVAAVVLFLLIAIYFISFYFNKKNKGKNFTHNCLNCENKDCENYKEEEKCSEE